jgi:hypothetical protein
MMGGYVESLVIELGAMKRTRIRRSSTGTNWRIATNVSRGFAEGGLELAFTSPSVTLLLYHGQHPLIAQGSEFSG